MDVRGPLGPRHQVLQADSYETDYQANQETAQVSVKVRHDPDVSAHYPVICD